VVAFAAFIVPVAIFVLAERVYGPCFVWCDESEDLVSSLGLGMSLALQVVVVVLLTRPRAAIATH
jgi:hypothetical protein